MDESEKRIVEWLRILADDPYALDDDAYLIGQIIERLERGEHKEKQDD